MRGQPVSRPPVTLFAEAILWRIQEEYYKDKDNGEREREGKKSEK